MNKKGQMDGGMPSFIYVTVGLILIGLLSFFFINEVIDKVQPALGNQSTGAGIAVGSIQGGFIGIWDIAIGLIFLLNVLLLLISAFAIDVHPAFVVIYFLMLVVLFIITPFMSDLLNTIITNDVIESSTSQLLITRFIAENLAIISLVLGIISGIIIYGKLRSTVGDI